MNFRYGTRVDLTVVNTGSPNENATIRANPSTPEETLRVGGITYRLLQFHWHFPGEHALDGEEFPMEMHLVHQREGAAGLDGLLVVGVWLVEEEDDDHEELDRIFSDLPEAPGVTRSVEGFVSRRCCRTISNRFDTRAR